MSNLVEIKGDLLQADVDVIAHQCNCLSRRAVGLAEQIFRFYPTTNDYLTNPNRERYGEYVLHYIQNAPFRAVLNLFTQQYPGQPLQGGIIDTAADRLKVFGHTVTTFLTDYADVFDTIAFPSGIGCGYGGGDWTAYRSILADCAAQHPEVEFQIVSLK